MSQPIVGEHLHYLPTGARGKLEMDQKLRFRFMDDERPFISEANNYNSAEVIQLRAKKPGSRFNSLMLVWGEK